MYSASSFKLSASHPFRQPIVEREDSFTDDGTAAESVADLQWVSRAIEPYLGRNLSLGHDLELEELNQAVLSCRQVGDNQLPGAG